MEPNINSNGMLNGLPKLPQEERKVGPMIAILVVVLIIIVSVLYFVNQNLKSRTVEDLTPTTEIQSEEDSAAVIDADLDAQLRDIDYSF